MKAKAVLVEVDLDGGPFYVARLSARQMLAFEGRMSNEPDKEKLLALQLEAFVCNADGSPRLTADQANALLDEDAQAIGALITAGSKANGFQSEEIAKGN